MAGIADLVDAPPAYYGDYFRVVSGTDWEISATALDGNGAPIAWSGCTARATLRRERSGTVVKTITQTLSGGLQIDLTVPGRLTLRATPACTFAAEDLGRPLLFNLQVTSTSPALTLVAFQRCFIVPQANLN